MADDYFAAAAAPAPLPPITVPAPARPSDAPVVAGCAVAGAVLALVLLRLTGSSGWSAAALLVVPLAAKVLRVIRLASTMHSQRTSRGALALSMSFGLVVLVANLLALGHHGSSGGSTSPDPATVQKAACAALAMTTGASAAACPTTGG
ncbi:hypothetical protein EV189_0541 [Motilibacter rhizosphaerae]|uniref:Uncharacterized protein n=1 Tax=Motilibacter rhizosphaerae TaxID=598652 RepID=A0A4Q7NVX0_9ACTN|nr:hypothetical protein [Motilibacter rhizosphaerae]RZS91304.1 hypothetical protein EV189_0541 [Motilibacter rhizosphaerae]